jgi:hypothetical protein
MVIAGLLISLVGGLVSEDFLTGFVSCLAGAALVIVFFFFFFFLLMHRTSRG